jgi:IS30 family transposase
LLNVRRSRWRANAVRGVRDIAAMLGRSPSTILRELDRNAATRTGWMVYRASVAQWKAELRSRRPKAAKLVTNPQLRAYVQDRLAGAVHAEDGTIIDGPGTPDFKGRNKPAARTDVGSPDLGHLP